MTKNDVSHFLRSLGLLEVVDKLRFFYKKITASKKNRAFKEKYPDIKLPPAYLVYESYLLNYHDYYFDGLETAKWLISYFEKYIPLKGVAILDWGCGPGRVIRHMPELTNHEADYFATDYNQRSIEWCKQNLKDISFNVNSLSPALPCPDNKFDIIYGLSIFTHLSEEMHYSWYKELLRTLKPGGILFITTHGDAFTVKLNAAELDKYKKGEFVERGNVREGHRTFTAFQPEQFMQKLFLGAEILAHEKKLPGQDPSPVQDVWIIRKKNTN